MTKKYSALDLFNKRAEEYQLRFMDVKGYAEGLDFFCEALKSNTSSVLDVACGPGNLTRYLLDKNPRLKILGIDIAPNMVRIANTNNPEAKFVELDCRNVLQLSQKFDGIVCGFCMPYLTMTEVEIFVEDCADLLNDNGIVYLSTMQHAEIDSGYQTSSHGEQLYTYYHDFNFLKTQFSKHTFEIIYQKVQTPEPNNNSAVSDLLLIVKKGSSFV